MAADTDSGGIVGRIALLAEPTRVRLVRLLAAEELTVGELATIVQLPQSTVSRHLKALLGGGWIRRRTEGASARVQLDHDGLSDAARTVWEIVRDAPDQADEAQRDRERMASILAQRRVDSRAFFGRVAAHWDSLRDSVYGRAFGSQAVAALLPPSWTVADLGCGTGEMAARLADGVTRVIAVDQEPSMLEAARQRLGGRDNVELVQADLGALPVADGCCDAAMCLLVLHHLTAPPAALAEARRILKPQGRLVVVDMVAHERADYRHTMGHVHLGFSADDLSAHAGAAGLVVERFRQLPADADAQGPPLFLATLVAG